jgi:S-adenosylmethionine:tRNA ribosyltransferase-isomerase
MKPNLQISDFNYDLPDERIAKYPLTNRADSKLLVYKSGAMRDHVFHEVAGLLPAGATLVFNNTRVVQARLFFEKTPAARPIEVFCLEPIEQDVQTAMAEVGEVVFECLVGNAKRWNEGLALAMRLDDQVTLRAEKARRKADTFVIRFTWNSQNTFAEILEMAGKVPLPPYLRRESEEADRERYQTVYARFDGSVAAPTAGLHFTEDILQKLDEKGITRLETTLHVGAGTFKPVSTTHIRDHDMHAEEIHVQRDLLEQLLKPGGPVIAVGTTSARTLESLYWMGVKLMHGAVADEAALELDQWEAYELLQHETRERALAALLDYMAKRDLSKLVTHTRLIIAPGYTFRILDGLFTNFHQPGSTLILLIAAILGDDWRQVYAHALANNYRFLSYGDANLYFIPKAGKA